MPYCPKCGGNLRHIHRRPIDKLYCYCVPVKRYRCRNIKCEWEGNLRDGHKKKLVPGWVAWVSLVGGAVLIGKVLTAFASR